MRFSLPGVLSVCVLVAACAAAPVETVTPTPGQPAPPPADARAIPGGAVLEVRLDQELSAGRARVGDTFTVRVTEPLVATNGQTVVPENSVVTGLVTGVGPRADGREVAAIRLNFVRISVDGVWHPITANIIRTRVQGGAAAEAEAAPTIITAAGAGAVLGAILGGELRDMLVGAILGAGAGTIISLGTGDVEPVLPEGTRMTIQTVSTVQLR
jgi:hypothetical protein